jgi:hypothetical protein
MKGDRCRLALRVRDETILCPGAASGLQRVEILYVDSLTARNEW